MTGIRSQTVVTFYRATDPDGWLAAQSRDPAELLTRIKNTNTGLTLEKITVTIVKTDTGWQPWDGVVTPQQVEEAATP